MFLTLVFAALIAGAACHDDLQKLEVQAEQEIEQVEESLERELAKEMQKANSLAKEIGDDAPPALVQVEGLAEKEFAQVERSLEHELEAAEHEAEDFADGKEARTNHNASDARTESSEITYEPNGEMKEKDTICVNGNCTTKTKIGDRTVDTSGEGPGSAAQKDAKQKKEAAEEKAKKIAAEEKAKKMAAEEQKKKAEARRMAAEEQKKAEETAEAAKEKAEEAKKAFEEASAAAKKDEEEASAAAKKATELRNGTAPAAVQHVMPTKSRNPQQTTTNVDHWVQRQRMDELERTDSISAPALALFGFCIGSTATLAVFRPRRQLSSASEPLLLGP
eukprot:gnl/TRDRNA2_/TRDRNA2_37663_c0_seq1.p1 gnl/TRDRNA2_/TRDRNA2_37663_c0~~gnl/TRDRNA2_/TRDRNA2_37663_c0_seq1.p1  ORF type:complete len:335 (+),score=134.33 gnl/TRDRNA2_/TRDRNA2_37663_c0_seq1:52-1056(+)